VQYFTATTIYYIMPANMSLFLTEHKTAAMRGKLYAI